MLTLHYAPNTVSVAVAIALEAVGKAYTPVRVDFANAAQTKAPYLALNPKGRVPALETDGGILTETGAILEYVAPDLIPADRLAQARMRELMYYLASTMHVAHAHKMRGSRWANNQSSYDDMQAKVPETMAACCAYLESTYSFAPYALGDSLTLADCYLTVVLSWVPGDGVDLGGYPKLQAFADHMRAQPYVAAVIDKGIFAP